MSTRCRFCGGKVFADAADCEHCGKVLKKSKSDSEEQGRLTNLESWDRSIPSWLMYSVVGFFLLCLVLMALKGCEAGQELPTSEGDPISWVFEFEFELENFIVADELAVACSLGGKTSPTRERVNI